MHFPISTSRSVAGPDPRLERALRHAVCVGAALTVLLPWRSEWLGFVPLWLLGMPLSAWWALHRFRLPAGVTRRRSAVRRRGGQARRQVEFNSLIKKEFRRAA